MDMFCFINSKDIREHLQQIGYSFTAPEAAFLVWQCRSATLKEKIFAWREIIETMPDSFLTRRKDEQLENCHDFLRHHIASQKTLLKEFPNGKDCVYQYETHDPQRQNWLTDDGWVESGKFFNSFDSCLSHCLRQLDDDAETDKIRFYRQNWCGSDGKATIKWMLETDREQNPIRVDRYGILGDELTDTNWAFSDMWFAFPTPFKWGDLVWDPFYNDAAPFVLDYLNIWDTQEMIHQGLSPDGVYAELVSDADKRVQSYRRTGCVMDMGAYGYGRKEEFGICDTFGGWANYLDMEFYPFELDEKYQILKPVSEFLKGNCDLELLLNSYTTLLLDSIHGKLAKAYQGEYTDNALKTAGLKSE